MINLKGEDLETGLYLVNWNDGGQVVRDLMVVSGKDEDEIEGLTFDYEVFEGKLEIEDISEDQCYEGTTILLKDIVSINKVKDEDGELWKTCQGHFEWLVQRELDHHLEGTSVYQLGLMDGLDIRVG